MANFLKFFKVNLALIFRVGPSFELIYEFLPVWHDTCVDPAVDRDCLIRVHFLMDFAVILVVLRWLEAHSVFTAGDLDGSVPVLSEVKALLGE